MPEYKLSLSGADRLTSLIGIKSDLESVLAYCDRMIEHYAGVHLKKSHFDVVGFTTKVNFVDWEALSTAAAISYARCFVSGVRKSLDDTLLIGADAELKSTHEFILHYRNKHVAHSVNNFEENYITVQIEDSFQTSAEIVSVVPHHERQSGLSFGEPVKLKNLAIWLLSKVEQEITQETFIVQRIVQNLKLNEIRESARSLTDTSGNRRTNVMKKRRIS